LSISFERTPVETSQALAGKRIAVIEEDVPLRDALVLFLRVKGWSVDIFKGGEESARVANWEDFAAVICDFVLAGEDGLSVLRRVRESSDKVVTVLIATYLRDDISLQAESAGVDRILFKPFSTMELVESLGVLTESRSGRNELVSASPQ
jgi:DNA-binding response OmpR family regulator